MACRCVAIDRWRERRHAWPKLWKHHSAQPVADRLNEVAARARRGLPRALRRPDLLGVVLPEADRAVARGPRDLRRRGGVHRGDRLDRLAADRARVPPELHRRLQGDVVADRGPARDRVLRGRLSGLRPTRTPSSATTFVPLGTRAGTLTDAWAQRLGLREDVAVAVGNVDSFVSVPGAGVQSPGTFVTVIGTSICDMVLGGDEVRLPGITGVARDGILPGLYGYEAGQVAVGDMLAWFVRTLGRGADAFAALEREAARVRPGRDGPGRARLVQRQPFDPRRRRPDRRDLWAHAAVARRPRSTERCWNRSRSATGASSRTSPITGSRSTRSWPAAESPSAAR